MPAVQDKSPLRSACYVNSTWIAAGSRCTPAVTNPATGETLAEVPDCGAGETGRAIAAASFLEWFAEEAGGPTAT